MEDILASIKKVIAEEKEMRAAVPVSDGGNENTTGRDEEPAILELDEPLPTAADLAPPLLDEGVAGETRRSFEELSTIAATIPPAPVTNPLEDVVRDMLKPILKQWVDEHLPQIVNDHVRREITRITGRKL